MPAAGCSAASTIHDIDLKWQISAVALKRRFGKIFG